MKTHKNKVRPLEVYLGNFERSIKKGLADEPVELSDCEVQVGYEVLYSKSSQRCYYYVKALPEYIMGSFYNQIRLAISFIKTAYPVFVNFRIQGNPHFINWESSEMKERRRQWIQYEQTKEANNTLFADAKTRASSNFDDWRIKSWEYVQNAEDRKVQLIDCEITVELSTDGNDTEHKHSLLDACREFEQWCAKNNIKIKKVRNNIMDFLQYTSITSLNKKTASAKAVMNRVLSSEILADMTSYVPGKIDDVGVLFGIDIMTGMAVYKNMIRKNGEAENFLVVAETGGGKSFYMKGLALQMAINGFHQVVLDIDGEYKPVAEQLGGVVIDMSKSAGLYFDSTVIGDLTGDAVIDSALAHDSQVATCSVFDILCDPVDGMTATETRLFNDAYTKMLQKYGVDMENKETWKNSINLSFHKLYSEICALADDPDYSDYHEELRAFIDKLYVFFDKHGIRSYLFQNPISLADILNHRGTLPMFVDIVLNLESADIGKVNIESLIKQLTATYLVTLLTNYYKSQHEFSVHYIEEYQRYSECPGVESLIVYMITGNRKRNAATFVISNSPTSLLKMGGTASQAIIDNITNMLIGKIKENAIDEVCKAFSLQKCKRDLLKIRNGIYDHAFILKINGKDTTLVRQSIPIAIAKSPMFKTRDTEKKDE